MLVNLEVTNFKKIKLVRSKPHAGVNVVSGVNAQGKSSYIDAVQALLGGKTFIPDRPIRAGEESAKIIGDLACGYRVTRTFSEEDGDKFFIEKIGEKGRIKSPQGFLDELLGNDPKQAFDVLAFVRLKPEAQAELLRSIVGLDTSALDAEHDTVYEERTAVGRDVKALTARVQGLKEGLDAVPEPPAEVDISAFLSQIEVATKAKAKNDAARKQLTELRVQIEDKCEELAIIERTYEAKRDEIRVLRERESKGTAIVGTLVDPDVSAIHTQVDAAKKTNAEAQHCRELYQDMIRRTNDHDAQAQELKQAERAQATCTTRLEAIGREKAALLAAVKMPVPGLSIDRRAVLLDGVPFSQASSMQQIRVGLGIAASLNSKLKIVLVREGSLLDDDALADVAKWSEENGVQVFLELVGSGRGGLELVDGEVRK